MARSVITHQRSVAGLMLVVALVGGLSLASLASARRTASAFTRYLVASDVSDVSIALSSVNEGLGQVDYIAATDPIVDEARRFPGVERDSTYVGLNTVFLAGPDGRGLPDGPEVVGSLDGLYTVTDRVRLLDGRLADPGRLDEVVINAPAAEIYGLSVGSSRQLVTVEGGAEIIDATSERIIDSTTVRVVGVVRFVEETLRDEYDIDQRVLVTPALTSRYLASGGFPYRFHALHLAPDADVSAIVASYEEVAGDDYVVGVRRTAEQREGAQLALRPIVVALAMFGVLTAVTALTLGSFAALRLVSSATKDAPVLRALGVPRVGVVATSAAGAFVGVALGVLVAALVAIALSALAPVGPVRSVEPDRGMDFDATVVLGGAFVLMSGISLVVILGARRVVRRAHTDPPPVRPSRVATAISALDASPARFAGLREGIGVGGHAGSVRPTIASCTVAIAAALVTLTFVASINGLTNTPSRYGWAADRALVAFGGYAPIPPDAADALADDGDIDVVAVASYALLNLGARTVAAMGIDPDSGDTAVTVLQGRLPGRDDEIALGVNTARRLGVGLGDQLDTTTTEATVVGIVAMPAIGLGVVSHPSMAQGAVLTAQGLRARNDAATNAVAFIDFETGADELAAAERARQILGDAIGLSPDAIRAYSALRPAELVDIESATTTVFVLTGVLIAAAAIALALTLSGSVRRRRHQLAVLAALGFSRRDLRRTIRWQTTGIMVIAVAIGVPIGVLMARVGWSLFARQIGVVTTPVVPIAGVIAIAVTVLIAAIVAGERPARNAASTRTAAALTRFAETPR